MLDYRKSSGPVYCSADGAPMLDAGMTLWGEPIRKCADCGMIVREPVSPFVRRALASELPAKDLGR